MLNYRHSFTLIELLVVIAIIGILAAFGVPYMLQALARGRSSGCVSNLHGLGATIKLYLDDHGGTFPVACEMRSLHLSEDPSLVDVLAAYLPTNSRTLRCPADLARKYYLSEGLSYQYHSTLGGGNIADSQLTRRRSERENRVLNDFEAFHGVPGQLGAMNFLFMDGHVGDLE